MIIEVMPFPIAFMFVGAMWVYAVCTFDVEESEDE